MKVRHKLWRDKKKMMALQCQSDLFYTIEELKQCKNTCQSLIEENFRLKMQVQQLANRLIIDSLFSPELELVSSIAPIATTTTQSTGPAALGVWNGPPSTNSTTTPIFTSF